jgi:hypothetical protein
MDHDFHGVVELVQWAGKPMVLHQRNAAKANLAIDDRNRNGLQAFCPCRARSRTVRYRSRNAPRAGRNGEMPDPD